MEAGIRGLCMWWEREVRIIEGESGIEERKSMGASSIYAPNRPSA